PTRISRSKPPRSTATGRSAGRCSTIRPRSRRSDWPSGPRPRPHSCARRPSRTAIAARPPSRPMDFSLSEAQRAIRATARRFARGALTDLARQLEERDEPVPAKHLRRYAEMGFLGINVPTAYGGQGLGNLEALLVLEEFAQVSPAVAFPVFESSVGPVRAIEHF